MRTYIIFQTSHQRRTSINTDNVLLSITHAITREVQHLLTEALLLLLWNIFKPGVCHDVKDGHLEGGSDGFALRGSEMTANGCRDDD